MKLLRSLFVLPLSLGLVFSACHKDVSQDQKPSQTLTAAQVDSPDDIIEWLDQQYQKQMQIELELAAVQDQLAQIEAQGNDPEQLELEMDEATYQALSGAIIFAFAGFGFSHELESKISNYLNRTRAKVLEAQILGDLEKIRIRDQNALDLSAYMDKRYDFLLKSSKAAERKAQEATQRFVKSNRFRKELEKIALHSTEQVVARLRSRSDAKLLYTLEFQAARLGRELTNAETLAITRRFERDLRKQSKPGTLKAIAEANRIDRQAILRFTLTEDYKQDRLAHFIDQATRKKDRMDAKTIQALESRLAAAEARIASSIEDARKVGKGPKAVAIITLGSGILYGLYRYTDGLYKITCNHFELSQYRNDLVSAELNLIAAQKEAESFMQATIAAAEEKGIDLKGIKTRGQEMQEYLDRLINYVRDNVSQELQENAGSEDLEVGADAAA